MATLEKTLDKLFVSKVRVKALEYFLLNPKATIHLRGAVRELGEEINAVRRELIRLESAKLIQSNAKGNKKYFNLNLEHPLVDELMSIFHKSFGLGGEIVKNSKRIGEVDFALLTPAYTKGTVYADQIVDLMIVGVVDMQLLNSLISKQENAIGREIHYSVLQPNEFNIRKRRRDDFLMNVLLQSNVMLIGSHDQLIS